MVLRTKRVYEKPSSGDGFRVLVDRIWPRGLTKAEADLDLWLKDVAPSTELRRWFDHDPAKMAEFTKRYREELEANPAVQTLREVLEKNNVVTLLYGAKNTLDNQAVVLAQFMQGNP